MRIKAIGVGTATITATVDGVPTSITVTVGNAPATLAFVAHDTTVTSIGHSYTPQITIQNSLGTTLANDAVTWTTSDQTIATVSSLGLITAIRAGGPVTIRATSPANATLFADLHVTVTNVSVSLAVSPATPTLRSIGETVSLSATVRNALNAVIASPSPAVSWGSSDITKVTVDPVTGVATAVAPAARRPSPRRRAPRPTAPS